MSSRGLILDRVRRNQPAATPMPEVPLFDTASTSAGALSGTTPAATSAATPAAFSAALARMGGVFLDAPAKGSLDHLIHQRFPQARVIVSATPEVQGTRPLADAQHPALLDDVDVGVVRALFGVAETGSVYLSETEFIVNALGFLPQHLVVLLDPASIVPNLHHAYQHRGFFEARYAALMTGPSATADIEGVLIRGAQGIRTMTVISSRRPT